MCDHVIQMVLGCDKAAWASGEVWFGGQNAAYKRDNGGAEPWLSHLCARARQRIFCFPTDHAGKMERGQNIGMDMDLQRFL